LACGFGSACGFWSACYWRAFFGQWSGGHWRAAVNCSASDQNFAT